MPYQFLETNIIGNVNVLEAIRKHKNIERYIYASSAYALSDKGSFYGISKKSSELIIDEYHKQFDINYTIIRYGSVYGVNADESNRIYRILNKIINDEYLELEGDGSEIREYINVDDAAQLSTEILNSQGLNQIFILTGIEKYTYSDLIKLIEEVIGKKINYKFKATNYDGRYKYTPYKFTPNLGKKLILNPSIDFAQGILKCLEEIYNKSHI
jgi:UDP-glucose 4-epimerase